jgi:hypothetical protein
MPQVRRTAHFRAQQRARGISEEEVVLAWTQPALDRPSADHPDARVRSADLPDGSTVTVVGRQTADTLTLITCWRTRGAGGPGA